MHTVLENKMVHIFEPISGLGNVTISSDISIHPSLITALHTTGSSHHKFFSPFTHFFIIYVWVIKDLLVLLVLKLLENNNTKNPPKYISQILPGFDTWFYQLWNVKS